MLILHLKNVPKKLQGFVNVRENPIYISINKDGNPSTKSTRHVEANVNTRKTKTIKMVVMK
jgi:hypothetical protein